MEDDASAGISAEQNERFFLGRDWFAFTAAFVLAFALYLYTVAPTVTLEDSGEMAVAADYLGVPHPPGYPLWTIISWMFTEVLSFARFRGQPNPAWCVGVMSAFFGALTAGLTAMLISRIGRKQLLPARMAPRPGETFIPTAAGIAAGLLMAFAPVPWSQSVIVEVYTMNAFLVTLQLFVAAVYLERPSNRLLYLLALLFGVALTHYFFASAVNGVIMATVIWLKDRNLFWEGTAGAAVLLALFQFGAGFKEVVGGIAKHFGGFGRWCIRRTSNIPAERLEVLDKKYALTLSALVCVLVVIGVIVAVRLYAPREDRTKSKAIQAGALLFGFVFAWCFLTQAYRAGSGLQAGVLAKKTAETLSGAVLILIPLVLWAIQSIFFGDIKKRYVAATIPLLLFICVLFAGSRWIMAFSMGHSIQPNMPPADAMRIVGRSRHVWYASLLLIVPPVIWILRGKVLGEWKRLAIMGLLVAGAWVCIHLYLPWSSDRNPPMNWGYPRTWEGFQHAVLRGQYQRIEPSNPLSTRGFHQMLLYFRLLFRQFTVPVALLGLLPFSCWTIHFGRRKLKGSFLALAALALLVPVYAPTHLLKNFKDITPHDGITAFCGVLIGLIVAFALAGLLAVLLARPAGWLLSRRLSGTQMGIIGGGAVLLLLLIITLGSVSPAGIRASFAPAGTRPGIPDVCSAELRTHLVQFIHLAFLAAALAALLAALAVLFGMLFRWAWRLKCEPQQKSYVLLSLIPTVLLICLAAMLAPVNLDSWFAFLKNPGAREHLFGAWVSKGGGIEAFKLGTFPSLLIFAALGLYGVCAFLVSIRPLTRQEQDPAAGREQDGEGDGTDAAEENWPKLSGSWDISAPFRGWLLVILYTFLGWGFLFAWFANIKFDVQDIFIQRVKFLSSYTVFSLWLGYGLILVVQRLLPNLLPAAAGFLRHVGLCFMLCLPAVPILNNAYNRDLITAVGAAEQTGHDFGWQFGNYQLRGADAILEELDPEEEPPPNPIFPDKMTQDAIFFGGTDPGRFVPTYMIYSADVRSDVYLITQNALADNTYMNVMRDLYGDRIWIPAQPDSALAFQRYVDEVRSGKRPKNAELLIRDGRVQISGALGVMEINGILAQMIFEHNNHKHDFYVEESYVIRWMYPYSSPHGLIMKINSKRTPLSSRMARDDGDFWDWYVRRLLADRKFGRDVVAKKSFSKLRSALAGLYAFHGRIPSAERAYHQARMLYPLSPEANFRLAQDVLVRGARFDEAVDLVADFKARDPKSTKTDQFLEQVKRMRAVGEEIKKLEKHRKDGQIDVNIALKLAQLYLSVNRGREFQTIMADILQVKQFPPEVYVRAASLLLKVKNTAQTKKALAMAQQRVTPKTQPKTLLDIATVYAQARLIGPAENAMRAYLERTPGDWKAWLDLGTMQASMRKNDEALKSIQKAVNYGGANAIKIINRDRQFVPFRGRVKAPRGRSSPLIDLPGLPTATGPRQTRRPGR